MLGALRNVCIDIIAHLVYIYIYLLSVLIVYCYAFLRLVIHREQEVPSLSASEVIAQH